ncbi:MAG: hypothetical protein WA414_17510 [Acidobacteriaceae bacterium]
MDLACHRCGNTLHEGEGFCVHCGAPQLMVEAADAAVPPPPPIRFRGDTHNVEWRIAITSALLVAIPVGLLAFVPGGSLFAIGGGFAAIALYRQRSAAFTDGRIGWRVGSILGIAAAAVAGVADALRMVVERYVLHQGAALDKDFASLAQQMTDQMLKSNPEAVQVAPQMVHQWTSFWLSADGHAAIGLSAVAGAAISTVLFAATGAAIAGRILAMRAGVQRSL